MSRDIKKCDPVLQACWFKLRDEYAVKNPGKMLFLTHTDRTVAEQQALFAKGRTTPGRKVTNCDGVKVKSDHNYIPSKAFDVAVKDIKTRKVLWASKHYLELGQILKDIEFDQEVYWGGDFKSFKDYPHFGCKTIYYTWIDRGLKKEENQGDG